MKGADAAALTSAMLGGADCRLSERDREMQTLEAGSKL